MIRRSVPVVLAFMAIWVVMVEIVSPVVLVSGLVVGVGTLVLTNRLLGVDYTTVFLSPLATLRYVGVLLREMTVAAYGMAVVIVRGRAEVTEFVYESALRDDLLLFLLANSMTLTPGSVAVDRDGARITVLTVDDVATARASCLRLERSVARLRKEETCS
ncbi:Na+/H+ antiporter subunit E [Xylanimonas ulmi]|uniref:Multicomponent Na+:H+ antiporter subunit E n=1 Tax=Xylanimonas ulmi TaxID=228973 RepID=A0A4Q7M4A5_9MICO|nr:Na+/H+ antiporter subunit E [Xylanibacterium ulmi]RZS60819.1 multicomponent Na+:H+ antiporter subunit E [Xylanibacterium ulmi]